MKITEANFVTLAKSLTLNGKKKYVHCGSSPSMTLYNSVMRITAYCHRCEERYHSQREGLIPLASLQEYQRQTTSTHTMQLPSDSCTVFKAEEPISLLWMTWLLKGGISQTLRDVYSLAWSKNYGRALLPVYSSTGEITDLVLRALLPQQKPKYLMDSVSPSTSVFLSKQSRARFLSVDPSLYLYDVVIVEDVLSAIRVGEFIPTGSLLGTTASQGKLERVLQHSMASRQPRVGLWLDPDQAGAAGNAKLRRTLDLFGLEYGIISSPKDPKNITDSEIMRRLASDRYHPLADYEAEEGFSYPVPSNPSGGTAG
ncbi:DNA primase [Rhizobium phage Palo]|uniref:DNA primase n=1 Tax=Rhizobium phage Palo TaxID=2767573 RepID=A0A7L8G6X2_9CAUD|nr:DNA primase [Rhizobium phage Palo]